MSSRVPGVESASEEAVPSRRIRAPAGEVHSLVTSDPATAVGGALQLRLINSVVWVPLLNSTQSLWMGAASVTLLIPDCPGRVITDVAPVTGSIRTIRVGRTSAVPPPYRNPSVPSSRPFTLTLTGAMIVAAPVVRLI